MLILTGLRLEWAKLCEQTAEGHILVGDGPQVTVRMSLEEVSSTRLPILSTFFNTICQKTIISSLPRCLKKPLETLYITNCKLTQSDLDYLPYCLNVFELKGLYLIEIPLRHLFLEPLGFLLERVRHTLECLVLKSCGMGEFHFNVLLPGISQCSQLIEVNFYDNELSLLFLKKLLYHTDKLSQITLEMYPAPLECYDNGEVIVSQRLESFCPELLDILRAKREPSSVIFATIPCSTCGGSYVYDLETQRCVFEKDLQ